MAASNALHQCMMSDYGCVSRGLRVLLDVYRQANLPVRHIRKCRLQLCFINTSTQVSVQPCDTACARRSAFVDVGCLGQL